MFVQGQFLHGLPHTLHRRWGGGPVPARCTRYSHHDQRAGAVQEHCHDALRVLQTLHESVRPAGGLLIFKERCYDHKWSKYGKEQQPVPFWDIMHPVNVKRAVIEALLSLYKPLYRRDFFYEKSYPTDEGVYFIGVKK